MIFDKMPKKSPEPPAVGAGCSAVAVNVARRWWSSFFHYAQSFQENRETQYVTALEIPPVEHPITVVRASIMADAKKGMKPKLEVKNMFIFDKTPRLPHPARCRVALTTSNIVSNPLHTG